MTRILICAAIGAVATCLVAWGIATVVTVRTGQWSRPSGIGDGWSYWMGRDFGSVSIVRVRAMFAIQSPLLDDYRAVRDREVPGWSGVHEQPEEGGLVRPTYIEEARGWPLRALRAEMMLADAGQTTITDAMGMRWSYMNGRDITMLPLRPIWRGFIFNTIFFSAIAFALMYAPGIVRRNLRRRAGRCEACGYDLRGGVWGAAGCPECGESRKGGEDAAR